MSMMRAASHTRIRERGRDTEVNVSQTVNQAQAQAQQQQQVGALVVGFNRLLDRFDTLQNLHSVQKSVVIGSGSAKNDADNTNNRV
jgi:hypothetical protein